MTKIDNRLTRKLRMTKKKNIYIYIMSTILNNCGSHSPPHEGLSYVHLEKAFRLVRHDNL
jgi:hypothetical protein